MPTDSDKADKTVQRVIKKYPNRRLYDTDTSAYITLSEVRQLVMDSEPFVVTDAKTGEDITRSILLQIILEEEEAAGSPMFTAPALANIIRFYGHAMQGMMGSYFEKNMQVLTDFQVRLEEQSKAFSPDAWSQAMGLQANPMLQGFNANVEQSRALFTQFQEQMLKQTEQMLAGFGIKR
jgi:polyhydroxyalkanoate synthesis repressor PhaR